MNYFPEEEIKKIITEYQTISAKRVSLLERYLERQYQAAKAREYATHGFLRRLKTLVRCIKKVFEILPPERSSLPTKEELVDAEINIQAFVFNIFGCIDNLAWIWTEEKNLTTKDGMRIHHTKVGLGKDKKIIRNSFSADFQLYLDTLQPWLENLENFRHALAHRIPLYIPPYNISPSKAAEYQALEDRKSAAIKRLDLVENERLSVEQMSLVKFIPCMTHSFEENSKIVVFHAQLLADFNTIDEIGRKMLVELDR